MVKVFLVNNNNSHSLCLQVGLVLLELLHLHSVNQLNLLGLDKAHLEINLVLVNQACLEANKNHLYFNLKDKQWEHKVKARLVRVKA